ncbi:hypothetical protein AVZ31_13405 [Mycolicibacterium neoaurum]|nr:hypothetical protein DXK33_08455 [Mycolicibacterium neoaurum]KUM07917.1 hypothetical protein AVZ31_13405 [Mycolicibacterium neoaurum]
MDIVEVIEVHDWDRWVEVRDHSPALDEVRTRFDELVEPGSVRWPFVAKIATNGVAIFTTDLAGGRTRLTSRVRRAGGAARCPPR